MVAASVDTSWHSRPTSPLHPWADPPGYLVRPLMPRTSILSNWTHVILYHEHSSPQTTDTSSTSFPHPPPAFDIFQFSNSPTSAYFHIICDQILFSSMLASTWSVLCIFNYIRLIHFQTIRCENKTCQIIFNITHQLFTQSISIFFSLHSNLSNYVIVPTLFRGC